MNTRDCKLFVYSVRLLLLGLIVILGGCASTPAEEKDSGSIFTAEEKGNVVCSTAPKLFPVSWYGNAKAACSITFDDGTLDQFLAAFPELERRGIPATFFVITDSMDHGFWMDGDTKYRLFSWDNAREIAAAGYEVASHSAGHIDLAAYPDKAFSEMTESAKDLLREIPNQPVFSFAWPYWRTSSEGLEAAASVFRAARSGGISDDPDNPRFGGVVGDTPGNLYAVGARGVLRRDSGARLTAVMDSILGSNGWLVPNFHGIESPGMDKAVLGWEALPMKTFSMILDSLEAEDFWFATFGDVARYIEQRNRLEISLTDFDAAAGIYRYRYRGRLNPSEYYMPLTLFLIPPGGCPVEEVSIRGTGMVQFVSASEEPANDSVYRFNLPPGDGYLEIRLQIPAGF